MLDDSCLDFIGRELWVRPYYGWGWHRGGARLGNDAFERIEAAGFFAVRVERLFRSGDDLRGLVGIVTSGEHLFAGFHVVAAEMHHGDHDFAERICRRYDLSIGPSAPSRDEWPRIEGTSAVDGYGTVGATRAGVSAVWDTPA